MQTVQSCEPPPAEAAAAAIHALNQQYIAASRTHDHEWFDRHMAPAAIIVLGDGTRIDKAEFLGRIRDAPPSYTSLTVENVTVRTFGAIAQVDADAPWQLEDGRTGVSRYIDTYAWLDCRWQVISAQITWLPGFEVGRRPAEPLTVEIRAYNLRPGTRDEFHRMVVAEAEPMLRRWNVDVVAYGPSSHDNLSYFMIRAYSSLDERLRSQNAFYGSDEWRDGPRDRILALIENYTSVVLQLDAGTVDALRAAR